MRQIIQVGNMTLCESHPKLLLLIEPGKARRLAIVALSWLITWVTATAAIAPYAVVTDMTPAAKVAWCCCGLGLSAVLGVAGWRYYQMTGKTTEVLAYDAATGSLVVQGQPLVANRTQLQANLGPLGHRVMLISDDKTYQLGWMTHADHPAPLLRVLQAHLPHDASKKDTY